MTIEEAIKFLKNIPYIPWVEDRKAYKALDMAIDALKCVNSSAFKDGYAKGKKDLAEKSKEWCSDALGSDELSADVKQGIALCLSWFNAEMIKEEEQ